ncbi:2-C-methyl-D-erythritol 2,4-cyclodiphosphate synthase [Fervidibacter sacchari]|jgi:2C-methyl-D-erythritol 2,4-cyclodiphosphate synthase|uniref:2-C-methyl-D-erythritol 2,4-cyclodiphosphate synthase n=1 Tax=Candidatus Fervidibacter sacchari TaxID=1448929 RepID=A0ABT2ESU4_9BACT|nr:2-C-methyl-D-erythritol 2,4-cyclodiphosphate synthase [Candidatus Fervidibacter sacchari]MCS3919978.1 2-C-methyl-D-erythritol 2,4-cyclodiphosphate synthase [Candidatus Fervidibacter sacchari]WKU16787.1 2-C-methyl-D-erythritol 2,4-cyclodiphosphate synthase [Candidatus Fervidibacter sacchari]
MEFRVGVGFDAHRFAPNRTLRLCGITIPHELGLIGHSDADVALHALCDALLGALALGDIGQHFPDTDPRYKDADSSTFLKAVMALVKEEGWQVNNVDITIIAQAPKLAPYRDAMRKRIAELLEIETDLVSVKATTTDQMGFVGRREGIAAIAVVSLTRSKVGEKR